MLMSNYDPGNQMFCIFLYWIWPLNEFHYYTVVTKQRSSMAQVFFFKQQKEKLYLNDLNLPFK